MRPPQRGEGSSRPLAKWQNVSWLGPISQKTTSKGGTGRRPRGLPASAERQAGLCPLFGGILPFPPHIVGKGGRAAIFKFYLQYYSFIEKYNPAKGVHYGYKYGISARILAGNSASSRFSPKARRMEPRRPFLPPRMPVQERQGPPPGAAPGRKDV